MALPRSPDAGDRGRSPFPGSRPDERRALSVARTARVRGPGPADHARAHLPGAAVRPHRTDLRVLPMTGIGWKALSSSEGWPTLAAALLAYARPRRWFRAKGREPRGARLRDLI